MEESLRQKLNALKKQAKEGGIKSNPSSGNRSSLHKFIKTKEQAERLMKDLKSASEPYSPNTYGEDNPGKQHFDHNQRNFDPK